MDDIDLIKNRIKTRKNRELNVVSKFNYSKFFSKILISIILFLVASIILKVHPESKEFLKKNIFDKNFSFASINKLYNKYFGNVLPVEKIFKEESKPVFKEELVYTNKEKYNDGVSLSVSDNYLVPILESGMVVFVGEKENFGNTVIVQQVNGVDVWYGNLSNIDVKLYDYIEKGKLLGEASSNLYLLFKKDGNIVDFNEYIK